MGVCKDCIWYNQMMHNGGTDKAYHASHCCTIDFEAFGGPIYQAKSNGTCTEFTNKDDVTKVDVDVRHDRQNEIVYCDECIFCFGYVQDGTTEYRCKVTDGYIFPAKDYCSYGRKKSSDSTKGD